jgi:hypothetical protein
MSEVTDLLMPILRIQADVADLKRDMAAIRQTLGEHTQKFEELEIYTAYETGLGTQNKADLQAIKKTIKGMEQRLSSLETTR